MHPCLLASMSLIAIIVIVSYLMRFFFINMKYLFVFTTLSLITFFLLHIAYLKYAKPNKRYDVVSTNGIIGSIVKEILGDAGKSCYIVPLGAEPHEYEINSEERKKMNEASLLISNGLGLEAAKGISYVISQHSNLLDLGKYCLSKVPDEIIVYEDGSYDPHLWMDAKMLILWTDVISSKLCKMFPKDSQKILSRSGKIISRMSKIDNETRNRFYKLKNKPYLVTNHKGFSYFVKSYISRSLDKYTDSPQGLSQFVEPNNKDIERVCEFIRKNKVKCLFRELGMSDVFLLKIKEILSNQGYYVFLSKERLQSDSGDEDKYKDLSVAEAMLIENSSIIIANISKYE